MSVKNLWNRSRQMHGRGETEGGHLSLNQLTWKRFLQDRWAVAGVIVILIITITVVLAPVLCKYAPETIDGSMVRQAPSTRHILGTDDLGRDIFSRLLYGGRVSMTVAVSATVLQLFLGIVMGALAGYFGKWVDSLIMRIADVVMCFPFYVIAVCLAAILGPGLRNTVIILGFLGWPSLCRMVRAEILSIKENDYILGIYEMNTIDTLLVFTTHGNYLHIPVHILPDLKWKDMPKHVSNVIETSPEESVVSAIPVTSFETDKNVVITTKNGMIKRSKLADFKLSRYSKPTSCMKLKEDDLVIDAFVEDKDTLFITTDSGYGLSFLTEEVPIVGVKAAGVKAMKLKDDHVVSINQFDPAKDEFISIITDKGTGKRVHLSEFELSTRSRRGLLVLREVKSNPYRVIKTFITDSKNYIGIKNGEISTLKLTELNILDRYSTGGQISKHDLVDSFMIAVLQRREDEEQEVLDVNVEEVKEKQVPKKEKVSLKEIDDRLMTIDDFLK